MARVVYLGDEVTHAGFRLAGADARVVAPGAAADELHRAVADGAELVLLSGMLAAALPAAVLAESLTRAATLLVIVPDACGASHLPDLAREVRDTLGLDA